MHICFGSCSSFIFKRGPFSAAHTQLSLWVHPRAGGEQDMQPGAQLWDALSGAQVSSDPQHTLTGISLAYPRDAKSWDPCKVTPRTSVQLWGIDTDPVELHGVSTSPTKDKQQRSFQQVPPPGSPQLFQVPALAPCPRTPGESTCAAEALLLLLQLHSCPHTSLSSNPEQKRIFKPKSPPTPSHYRAHKARAIPRPGLRQSSTSCTGSLEWSKTRKAPEIQHKHECGRNWKKNIGESATENQTNRRQQQYLRN